MNIEKQFNFLVNDYGLKHAYQEFNNCYDGYWWVYTHSYYNESGCFTIHVLPQRGEIDFFFAQKFSNIREELCERQIDIQSIGQDEWRKSEKKLSVKLFGYSKKLLLETLAKVIKLQIEKYGSFFGIKVV